MDGRESNAASAKHPTVLSGGRREAFDFLRLRATAMTDDSADIDMTPMVDVTFLLLIFFVMTAAFSLQKSIEVPTTEDETRAESRTMDDFADDTVIVRVDQDNIYWISSPAWHEEREAPNAVDMLIKVRKARAESATAAGTEVNQIGRASCRERV